MTKDISVVIITGNEEDNIRDCLESVSWADEIVVLDSMSRDRTVEIAKEYTDRVYQEEWKGFAAQKMAALRYCTGRWILSIDADERVTWGLQKEIDAVFQRSDDDLPDGFFIPRKSFCLGRWIRRGGWYPDRKLRLARRELCRWVEKGLHERLEVPGRRENLENPLLHYTYRDLSDHLSRIDLYTSMDADYRFADGQRAGLGGLLFRPFFKFFRMYFLKGGILEGRAGLILAAMGAYYAFLKTAKLWELGLKGSAPGGRQEE